MALQPDQKIIVGGNFTTVAGAAQNRIARWNTDGTLDLSFNPGDGANGIVYAAVVQDDGKILLGGSFTRVQAEARNRIARLHPDGTLDKDFNPPGGLNADVYAIVVRPEGSILVAGAFTQANGEPKRYLAQLKANGTTDSAFVTEASAAVRDIVMQSDGKIVLGGDFTSAAGQPRNRVARLNSDGSLDSTFDPARGPNASVYALALQSDNKVVLGGSFRDVNGLALPYLARLNTDGLADTTFGIAPGLDNSVYALAVQPDGKILAGGNFTQAGGQPRNRVVRLRADGSIDPSFDIGAGANNQVNALALQPDGNVVVGGSFTQFAGLSRGYFVRLQGLGAAGGGEIEFGSALYTVLESQPSASLEVRRSGNTSSAITVDYATSNGTATAGDYTPQSGKLVFGAGETSKMINVPIRADALIEDTETLNLSLSNPTGGAVLGSLRTAQLLINNDDFSTAVGGVDVSFAGSAAAVVQALALQPDGKLIVAGDFADVSGFNRLRVARLNSDGTVDQSFNASTWLDKTPWTVAVQGDGRVLMGGDFTVVNGVTRNRLARLREDGSLDETFNSGTGPNSTVRSILVQPNGDILVGGLFSQFNGQPLGYLVKLFTDGSLDSSFAASVNNKVYALAQQLDGKIVLGGDFTSVTGQLRNRVARLNSDGSLDTTFDPAAGANGAIYALALLSDNKIVMGGLFRDVNGLAWSNLARLNADGLPDATFGIGPGLDNSVYAVAVQPDGKILVGGNFTQATGQPRNRLVRLRADGGIDPSFEIGAGANNQINALALQPDGNVVVGGSFTQFNGLSRSCLVRLQGLSAASGGEIEFGSTAYAVLESQPSVAVEVKRGGNTSSAITVDYTTSNGTATAGDYIPQSGKLTFGAGETSKIINVPIRADTLIEDTETLSLLLSNPTGGAALGSQRAAQLLIGNDDASTFAGAVDVNFSASANNAAVRALAVQADGKLIVAGEFGLIAGLNRLRLARLNTDGTVDSSFNASTWMDKTPLAVTVQSDGRILIGGDFTVVNGVTRSRLARLRDDGILDETFNAGTGPNSSVRSILVQPNGDVLVGGMFNQFNGQPPGYLVKLFSDGSPDATFGSAVNNSVYALAQQPDGKIVLGGDFTSVASQLRNRVARLNSDGSLDTTFDPAAGANASVYALALQVDNKVVMGGSFKDVNGLAWSYLARLNVDGLPDAAFGIAPGLDNSVYALAVQPDGKILVGGNFTQVTGQPRNRLVRLRADGAIDPSFDIGAGANNQVNALALQPDGNVVVGGSFTQFGGLSRSYLVRLQGLSAGSGGEIEFGLALYTVLESQPSVDIEVKRSGNTSSAITIDYATSNGTATAGDYTPQSGKLVFGVGETSKMINVLIRADALIEDTETLNLSLSNPTGGAVLGSQRTAQLLITNDDFSTEPGRVDLNFIGSANAAVRALAVQPDGKLIVGGEFSTISGLNRLRLARLGPDGTVDPSFHANSWLNNTLWAVAVDAAGRILIGGDFTIVNGVPRNRVARFQADGTLDESFNPGTGPNSTVRSVLVQANGDILAGGLFSQYDGQALGYLIKLFSDGSVDSSFTSSVNNKVYALVQQRDGKILLGGDFTSVGAQTRNRVARLSSDGSLDTTFDPATGPNSSVYALAVQSDDKIIIAGAFSQVGARRQSNLARLNSDGTLDEAFTNGNAAGGAVNAILLQPDGQIIAGGAFTSYAGTPYNYLVRLNSDGSADPAFDIGSGPNAQVNAIVVHSNSRLTLGGNFTQLGGLSRQYIGRLFGSASTAASPLEFQSISVVNGIVHISAKGQIGETYALEQSEDLRAWRSLETVVAQSSVVEFAFPVSPPNSTLFIRAKSD